MASEGRKFDTKDRGKEPRVEVPVISKSRGDLRSQRAPGGTKSKLLVKESSQAERRVVVAKSLAKDYKEPQDEGVKLLFEESPERESEEDFVPGSSGSRTGREGMQVERNLELTPNTLGLPVRTAFEPDEIMNRAIKEVEDLCAEDVVQKAFALHKDVSDASSSVKGQASIMKRIASSSRDLLLCLVLQERRIRELERDLEKKVTERVEPVGTLTYADKARMGGKTKLDRIRSRSRGRQNVILVYPKDEISSKDTQKNMEEEIDMSKIKGGICGVRKINKGGIAIELDNKEDMNNILEQINKNDKLKTQYEAALPKKQSPQVIIFNVSEEIDKAGMLHKLRTQNEAFNEEGEFQYRTNFRGKYGINWVFSVGPKIFKKLMIDKRVHIGWSRYAIKENIRPLLCYRCGVFGHIGRVCKGEARCIKCGEVGHERRECDSIEVKCQNCCKFNIKSKANLDVKHSCTDRRCKMFEKELQRISNRTDYGE